MPRQTIKRDTAAGAPAATKKGEQARVSREKLLEAATGLFADRGYRGASVQAIGERAGVSRGSIFWHFGSKEGLLLAVVARAFTEWETDTLVPDVGDASGIEAVRRAIRSHRAFLEGDAATLKLLHTLMFEALGPRPELAGEFAQLHDDLRRLGTPWIAAGIERGEIRDDVDPAAVVTLVTAVLGGIAYQYLLDESLDLDRLYGDLERLVKRALAA